MNLYEFSQVNNNEMGILIRREEDPQLYKEAFEESQRIIRISEEVRISLEKVAVESESKADAEEASDKLTTSKLAAKHGLKTPQMIERLMQLGYLEDRNQKPYLSSKGKEIGGEFRMSSKFGPYFLWPESLKIA